MPQWFDCEDGIYVWNPEQPSNDTWEQLLEMEEYDGCMAHLPPGSIGVGYYR
jgi:hypothetical protein